MTLASVDRILSLLRTPLLQRWGVPFPLIDLSGAVRLSVVLRQIKKLKGDGLEPSDTRVSPWTSALILFGGEAVMCSLLSLTPSFLLYPNVTLLFMGMQFLVNETIGDSKSPPPFRFYIELPIAFFDAFGRALLLCDFAPSLLARHSDPAVANSPLALLITSEVLTNGGFFFVNLLNMLDPRGWRVDRTPPEALPWGWTAVDLWSAPVITALWATLTHLGSEHNQPFWMDLHTSYAIITGLTDTTEKAIIPQAWSHSDARALCIVILCILFVARTWWNMGPLPNFQTKPHPVSSSSSPAPSSTSHVELAEASGLLTTARKRRNKHSRGKSMIKVE
ncbi:hypothetical protein FRC10_005493 [Ceratobasidium sp. 414]|nr:hypothetical protein FRC10_005493 [Ceratobasidium sp. 414]